ncbi:S8/S53 family peptidase [Arcobacter lacus]|uniref:subtilisin-like serine protease QhpE n=1 Tax=Arcobacter lacus TaxID=1912876 RepID=UPI0021BAB609|nr:S8/S53 family peptidase [Arcobacter lacus]MCT7908302.1 S8/S53 family peptidase [Arcobacter lacus]
MSKEIYVAIIDSGCSFETYEKIAIHIENNRIKIKNQNNINFEHGNVIGNIIKDENTNIYDIQVFNENLSTTPNHIFGALNYLLDKKVDVISMSLGLKTNYKEIENLVNELINKGVVIVSSFPRRGEDFVYPASYNGVIKVTSEGMCLDDNVVALDKEKLFFGANPFSSVKNVSGSSVAVAKFTKEFCSYLKKGFKKEEIIEEFSKRIINEPK